MLIEKLLDERGGEREREKYKMINKNIIFRITQELTIQLTGNL